MVDIDDDYIDNENSRVCSAGGNATLTGKNGQATAPALSEDGLALKFSSETMEDWRYVSVWNQWLQWKIYRWEKESTLKIYDLARDVSRRIYADAVEKGVTRKTVVAIERLARADRRHAATDDQWDKNIWLLNTPIGIIDLHTGKLSPSNRNEYMIKSTFASPVDTDCPLWHEFLRTVTNNDDDLAQYLARVAGYALTGSTKEQSIFFIHGPGANGKGIFLDTLAHIMGDYSIGAPMDMFLDCKNDRHPTDVAGLRGARLVTASEIDKNRRWAEAKIKDLTGGAPITARFMRQDNFTFIPQFTLLLAGNNKPVIRDVDEAIKRRMHLIPFTVTIPPERRDRNFAEKLWEERDGILQWAIEGCLDWQRSGLRPPDCVVNATEQYLTAEDTVGRWIEDACINAVNSNTKIASLYASWKQWAEANGEYIGNIRKLADDLTKRGYKRVNSQNSKCLRGLALIGDAVQTNLPGQIINEDDGHDREQDFL